MHTSLKDVHTNETLTMHCTSPETITTMNKQPEKTESKLEILHSSSRPGKTSTK